MIFRTVLLAVALLSSPAVAQQQNPVEQRIASQLGSLIIQNTAQAAQIEQLNAENAKLKAELEKLKKPAGK